MPLASDQVQIMRNSGSLLLGPGTPYTVLPGWDPWSRTNRDPQTTPRPYAHGSLVGAEWVDEAVVIIPVSVYRDGSTKADWLAAHQQLAKAFTAVGYSGEMAELRFEWGGSEFVLFGRPRQVRVTADNISVGKSVEQCAFVAPDPRIYSAELATLSTGLPVQQGGVTVPFTAPMTVPGVLVGGTIQVTNAGTADSGLTLRIDGPASEPRVILLRPDGTVQSIRFLIDLAAGQWLEIDSTRKLALLNGLPQSNQRGNAIWDMDAYPLQPGVNELRFLSSVYNDTALLTANARSAWW